MKRSVIIILLFASLKLLSSTDGTVFTISGYVSNMSGNEVYDNFPVIVYPNSNDTTKKFTVYTNNDGFYYFTHLYENQETALVVVRGYCGNNWKSYTELAEVIVGETIVDFRICHNPNWFMKNIVIKGQVFDSINNLPVPEHDVFITFEKGQAMSHSLKTNLDGFYCDTININSLDSLNFNISTYTFCNKGYEFIYKRINGLFCDLIEVNFNICTESNPEWTIAFYYEIFNSSNEVYFSQISNFEADSVYWDFGDGLEGKGKEIFHLYTPGSYKVNMTVFKNEEKKTYSERVIIGKTISLTGNVYASGVPLKNGYVIAVASTEWDLSFSLIDVCEIKNGHFKYDAILKGEYFFYAFPNFELDTLYFPKYIGTYHDMEYSWANSKPIDVQSNINNFRIDLIKNEDIYVGENSVNFNIDSLLFYNFEAVNVVLYNSKKEPINSLCLNSLSTKSFDYLPDGKYDIVLEIPGYEANVCTFELKSNDELYVNFFLNNDIIDYITYYAIDKVEYYNINTYPNPFNEFIIVNSDKYPLEIEIYDIAGSIITSNFIYSQEPINLNFLNSGLYLTLLKSEGKILERKILVKN
ncbi:MAG: T9SS type A sorting domain-containing protein [Bacteroidales bacterium]|nr:T9SS type A sorting domain-containing protein [Bacteroidales bacterium]